jgi:hypothetical protein
MYVTLESHIRSQSINQPINQFIRLNHEQNNVNSIPSQTITNKDPMKSKTYELKPYVQSQFKKN